MSAHGKLVLLGYAPGGGLPAGVAAFCSVDQPPDACGPTVSGTRPGGIHLLNGLYDAKLDHTRVLAITGLGDLGTRYGIPAGRPSGAVVR